MAQDRTEYFKAYQEANPEKIAARKKAYYEVNKEKILAKKKAYYESNKDKRKAYYESNKEKILAKNKAYKKANKEKAAKQKSVYRKIQRETNSLFKLNELLRARVKKVLKAQNAAKNHRTSELLGTTIAKAYAHLESLFQPGMSWDNHGEWHIDHIIPCASFDLTKPAEQKKCFHYTNLQPLWAADNLSKGASL